MDSGGIIDRYGRYGCATACCLPPARRHDVQGSAASLSLSSPPGRLELIASCPDAAPTHVGSTLVVRLCEGRSHKPVVLSDL